MNIEAASNEVEVANPQTGQLAPPQPGVREHQYEEAVALPRRLRVDGRCQLCNLLTSEELALLRLPRHLQTGRRVGRDASVVNGDSEAGREHVHDLADRAGALRGGKL